jgi:uncharacterized secreted repeat protein (TIGR03808 family)
LKLPNGAQLIGVRGATIFQFTGGSSLIGSEGASGIALTGLTLDGTGIKLAERRGLVHFQNGLDVRIQDCNIVGSGGYGIWFESIAGEVSGNTIRKTANTAFTSFDALGLLVAQNTIQDASDNGSKYCAIRWAMTAQSSSTTVSKISRPDPAAPVSTATRLTHSGLPTSLSAATASATATTGGARQLRIQHPDHRQQRQ